MSDVKTKKCLKCCEEKPLTDFYKDRRAKDGLFSHCKSCVKKYYKENKQAIIERTKKYQQENKEAIRERKKKYNKENKEAIREKKKKYYQDNKEYFNKYRQENKEARREYEKKWRADNKEVLNEKKKKYNKERYANDPEFRTSMQLRAQTKRLGKYKNTNTIDLIGCSAYEFWQINGSPSIEELRDLHIDHIIPLSWFDLTNEDHVKVSCHYLNLQYLSSEDNISKGDRYMGSPDNILAYKEDVDVDALVSEMLVIINELN